MEIDLFSNPYLLIIGFLLLLVVLYLWNKANSNRNRSRRQRSFRKNYQERRKAEQKEN